ncbi:MAG: hypothetical protein KGJ60_04840 [Verrucomicrobiota bacterium]|nr:hypothetical protein [Verrucomicrobiota bacterium]
MPSPNCRRRPAAVPGPLTLALAEVQKQADRILLTHYSPAGVVVNRHLDVLQFRGRTGPYLEHPQGEASLNLLKMAREGLLLDLRTLTTRAIRQNVRIRQEVVSVKQNGHVLEVKLEVIPFQVPHSAERFYLVLFEPVGRLGRPRAPEKARPAKTVRGRTTAQENETRRLREELGATRESLQAMLEELQKEVAGRVRAEQRLRQSNDELQVRTTQLRRLGLELTRTEYRERQRQAQVLHDQLHQLLVGARVHAELLRKEQSNRELPRRAGPGRPDCARSPAA